MVGTSLEDPTEKMLVLETYSDQIDTTMKYRVWNADPEKLNKISKAEYDQFLTYKSKVGSRKRKSKSDLEQISAFESQVLKGWIINLRWEKEKTEISIVKWRPYKGLEFKWNGNCYGSQCCKTNFETIH